MQCASSTAMSEISIPGKYSWKRDVSNHSGETYKNLQLLSVATFNVLITSFRVIPAYNAKAVIPFFRRFSTWSFINAIRGEITRHSFPCINAGTWKHIDFPPPVGSTASVSFPFNADRMMSCCKGRNASKPQYFFNIEIGVSSFTLKLNFKNGMMENLSKTS